MSHIIFKTKDVPAYEYPPGFTERIFPELQPPDTIRTKYLLSQALTIIKNGSNAAHTTGHYILAELVKSFKPDGDKLKKVYPIEPSDRIYGHLGVNEGNFMRKIWHDLPQDFRNEADNRPLLLCRDCVRSEGIIYIPALMSRGIKADLLWIPAPMVHSSKAVCLNVPPLS